MANRIASAGGSWSLILLLVAFLIVWAVLNMVRLTCRTVFDPYPYIFLNLVLSMLSALQAPVVMVSPHRQTERDRIEAQAACEVDPKARWRPAPHDELDALRETQRGALVQLQQEQIALLQHLLAPHDVTAPEAGAARSAWLAARLP